LGARTLGFKTVALVGCPTDLGGSLRWLINPLPGEKKSSLGCRAGILSEEAFIERFD
jgi:hypothetical protein